MARTSSNKKQKAREQSEDAPVDTPCGRPFCVSRTSSHDSVSHGLCSDQHSSSEEIERLCQSLNEAMNEPPMNMFSALIYEILQALVTLWMCIFSFFYTYAWRQEKKKFLMSVFVVIPSVVIVGGFVSGLLIMLVILGKIYSGLTALKRKISRENEPETDDWRNHSYSLRMASLRADELLKRSLCRRHSSAQAMSHLNQQLSRRSSQNSRDSQSGGSDQHTEH
ncbi:hypothetical protein DICVIV_04392 [Dictyocaulus viviparus]|uniref:Uncharacterized protein n=1 Tax=Dictyocaulus viviparus TaxID=29172 RepID=A0A0D8XY79_DICVI|nr:hypothetical protein DICVIV_04392 [Dictyocaulus viviparus]